MLRKICESQPTKEVVRSLKRHESRHTQARTHIPPPTSTKLSTAGNHRELYEETDPGLRRWSPLHFPPACQKLAANRVKQHSVSEEEMHAIHR